jgi:hypothetical protein
MPHLKRRHTARSIMKDIENNVPRLVDPLARNANGMRKSSALGGRDLLDGSMRERDTLQARDQRKPARKHADARGAETRGGYACFGEECRVNRFGVEEAEPGEGGGCEAEGEREVHCVCREA